MTRSAEEGSRARLLRRILIGLVAFAVVFHVAGGWYFSGQIYSSALRVNPATVEMNLRVVAIGSGSITVHEQGEQLKALRTDEVYGLKWDTGFGRISGAVVPSGADVTRTFALMTGTAPVMGAAAGLSRDAFPDDPAVALGKPVEQVSYTSPLGSMPAWFVAGRSSTWAVLVHGQTASRSEMLRAMRVTVRAGLPSLDITYRNDVGAPPDPSHRYEFGRTEWHDLEAAVLYAQQHGARSVVLVGASMGGAIVASFMQHSSHVSLVSALVLDAPMLSFDRTVDLGASEKSIPLLGLPLPPTLTWTAKRLASVRYDVDWSALNYLHDTAWDRVPTLVFHGDADQRVPLGGSRVLDRRQPDRVDLVVVPGVGHLESWNKDPQAYEQKLTVFLSGRT